MDDESVHEEARKAWEGAAANPMRTVVVSFVPPSHEMLVVEAASYEATKGTDEQAVLLQDRKWSTLNGVTLAKAMESKKFAIVVY